MDSIHGVCRFVGIDSVDGVHSVDWVYDVDIKYELDAVDAVDIDVIVILSGHTALNRERS